MPNPFSVFIIESLQPEDLLDDRTEGRLLREGLNLIGVTTEYRLTVDGKTFGMALVEFLEYTRTAKDFPILHLSVHGNEAGIVLTSGAQFTWDALRLLLVPVNRVLAGNLFLSLSACYGASGCQMAMTREKELPFRGLLSHAGAVDFAGAAVAYTERLDGATH